jgi:hypothetical protein
MRRILIFLVGALALALGGWLAPAALGAEPITELEKYAIESASVSLTSTQAGAHADFTTTFELSHQGTEVYAYTRDVIVELPPGLAGNPEAFPKCTMLQFTNAECPQDSQVGSIDLVLSSGNFNNEPIYNMPAPGGDIVARFGFIAAIFPTLIDVRFDAETNGLIASVEGAASGEPFGHTLIGATSTFWGVPADPVHDPERITPQEALEGNPPPGGRPSSMPEIPFMSNPTGCEGGRQATITVRSYQRPELPSTKSAPLPQMTGCGLLEFNPSPTLKPTTSQGTSGTGLDYELGFPTKGLEFANLNAPSHLKRAEVVLPEGMTVNPSQAEGLGVCTEQDLAQETYNSLPNVGCPESSKIGSVEAITPVIDRNPKGSLYLAKPYQNPFDSLLALYMVLKIPDRGVLVKLAGKVTLDPETGQITTVFDEIPQLPVAEFKLHFREGARAPLVTPAACGSYTAISNFNPWSVPGKTIQKTSSFAIESGPDRGPCPTGGLPPFKPGLIAGSINNAAGAFSPFNVRLTRTDAEQEITHFSVKLPPGLVAKLSGVPFCPEAAIAAAKARTGIHGGEEEIESPSCPAASEIGHSLAGAGVGQVLVYVPGKVYLAGPYNGSALSIVAITAAKAGPFDLGTVVIREALQINPETGEVFVDATGSDPIPHIIAGVPVRLKDIRAYVDRPNFALNPTDCTRTSTASTVRGAGLDFTSEADNNPITVSTPFQVADCAALPFQPKLSLRLKGGTRRGAHPALVARLRMNGIGEAGIARSQVTLPKSEFIENAHFETICTRVQFKAGSVPGAGCPAGSIYGKAQAVTPILDEPLEGNVFLRSSEHELPDLVLALHSGKIDVVLVGTVDSVNERLRTTFEAVPDAPVTSFALQMQGGKKGLFVNSTNLCLAKRRAISKFTGQNGKQFNTRPVVRVKCAKASKANKRKGRTR